MPERDATLDAFISSSDDDTDTEPDTETGTEPNGEAGTDPDTETEIDPPVAGSASADAADGASEGAVTTMAWSPTGVACAACGDSATRRWRTDSGFVCESCVDWERTPNQ